MTALPERTVEAAVVALVVAATGTAARNVSRFHRDLTDDALAAAMDPALGPDRLVVAGEHEREAETLRAAIATALPVEERAQREAGEKKECDDPGCSFCCEHPPSPGPALGPEREKEVRADQTRRIVEWLLERAERRLLLVDYEAVHGAAEAIQREFGGGDDA